MGLPFHRLDHPTLIRTFLEGADARTGGWIVTPNLDILRHCPPSDSRTIPRSSPGSKAALRRAGPTLVLVGLGFPKQERLIRLLRSELPQAWLVGVGISLSFLAGEQPRSPALLQRLGLEWMHRLWHEPRRLFRRYVVQGLPFGVRLLAWALAHRLRRKTRAGFRVAFTKLRVPER